MIVSIRCRLLIARFKMDEENRIELLEARIKNLLILKESLERSLSRERERNETLEMLLKKAQQK